jgi:hypothetical protein
MRAQAAIEYLTTYGWAIIVLIIMVTSLSAFGVIRPRNWAPDRCELGAEFHCADHVFVRENGELTLRLFLRNNLRDRVTIDGDFNCTFESTAPTSTPITISIGSEEEKEINCTTTDSTMLNMDGKIRASFTFPYKKKDGIFEHEIDGNAFSQVVIA